MPLQMIQQGGQSFFNDLGDQRLIGLLLEGPGAHEALKEYSRRHFSHRAAAEFFQPVRPGPINGGFGVKRRFRVGVLQVTANDLGVRQRQVAVDQGRDFAQGIDGQIILVTGEGHLFDDFVGYALGVQSNEDLAYKG